MTEDDKNWLAADYVLGVMRGAERTAFELQLKSDPGLAKRVLDWQQRLSLIEPGAHAMHASMTDEEVDAALSNVFDRVCKAIDGQNESAAHLPNPLTRLSREQLAGMRPAVVRLVASYLVLLERLKAQQARLAGSPSAA
ncbi:MAG TPA: hypothetical protein VFV57_06615 [Limnobacter sp.]|nr:hypothetical protein [Limnobacter sp.]